MLASDGPIRKRSTKSGQLGRSGESRSVAPRSTGRADVRLRAVAIGTAAIPFNAFWIVRLERVLFGPYPSTIALFANVVFELFVLVGVNGILRRVAPRLALSQGELLTIYTMLGISTGLAGLDGVGILAQIVPHAAWFGKTNGWTFVDSLPHWLVVSDRDILRGHFLGNSTFYRPEVLRAWATPILAWSGFVTVLFFTANCVNVLVRRQWADKERLSFPITWLPVEMTDYSKPCGFFRNRLLWAGFAVAAGLSLWNGIAFLYPNLPSIAIGITDLKPSLTVKPWSAIDWMPITFYPLAIGLGFLLPTDLLFSSWFFYFFWKAQVVVSSAMGWDATPDFPFTKEQGFGSLMGLFLFYLFTGRATYVAIWRSAVRGRNADGDAAGRPAEALGDRAALIGVGVGALALTVFACAAGAAWWAAAAFFAIFLATMTVIARIRAELGPPVHDFHYMGPDAMLPRAFGASAFGRGDLAFFTFGMAFNRAHRGDTMPVGLEGLQMAHQQRFQVKRMFGAIILATAIGAASTFWAIEHQAYLLGASAKFNQGTYQGQEAFDRLNSWISGTNYVHPNRPATLAMGVGVITALALAAIRLRVPGFPLHPIGYAIASSWSIGLVWMPLLIAWTLKTLVTRYGGLRAYRRFVPFFLGLALGDCVMGSVWGLVSVLGNMRTYNFFGA